MLSIKTTKLLTGVEIKGDYEDLNAIYDALSNVVGEEGYYKEYEPCSLRIMGLCYEIRHAYQGDRKKSKSNDSARYYSFNYLWPELIFVAAVLSDFISIAESGKCYLNDPSVEFFREDTRQLLIDNLPNNISLLRYFQGLILNELRRVIGSKRSDKIRELTKIEYSIFRMQYNDKYCTQMIDILNIKYLKRNPERRVTYLATITQKILEPDYEYENLKEAVLEYAKEDEIPYYRVMLEGMNYPDDIEW